MVNNYNLFGANLDMIGHKPTQAYSVRTNNYELAERTGKSDALADAYT